jgi:hypothetical protein
MRVSRSYPRPTTAAWCVEPAVLIRHRGETRVAFGSHAGPVRRFVRPTDITVKNLSHSASFQRLRPLSMTFYVLTDMRDAERPNSICDHIRDHSFRSP